MTRFLFSLIVLFLIGTGCRGEMGLVNGSFKSSKSFDSTPQVVFEYWHENNAWGYRSEGFFVTSNGEVFAFFNGNAQARPIHDGPYFEDELYGKYAYSVIRSVKIGRVPINELSVMAGLIPNAGQGKLVEVDPRVLATDIGSFYLTAYQFNEKSRVYAPVALSHVAYGEAPVINSSSQAKALIEWLLSLAIEVENPLYPEVFPVE